MARTDFAHLHVHTEHSLLDGLDPVERFVSRAKAMGQTHLAITDHGFLSGCPAHYRACRQEGVNPILGSEFYFVPDARMQKEERVTGERFHVIILANDARGFEILTHLSTESHKNYYYKPLIDRAMLEGLSKSDTRHLNVLSGCAGSILSRKVLGEYGGEAEAELEWWTSIFQNFYIELQNHETEFDRQLNRGLLKLAKKFDLPWVVTNDPHFVLEEDCGNHDALLAIQTASDIDDPNRFRFEGSGYWLKSRAEMRKSWKAYKEDVWKLGAANALAIAKETDIRIPDWDKMSWHIPKFPDVEDAYAEVKRLCWKALRRKELAEDETYVAQLKHELKSIKKVKGMADFLLITADVIKKMAKQGRITGPGRGSVAGCMVAWLLGIHKVDPIRYGLMFERFLNPDRPKMPDVDTDFAPEDRPFAQDYVVRKYGAENVSPVAAYQVLKTKRAFQSMAAAYGISFQDRMVLSKKFETDFEGNDILPEELLEMPEMVAHMERITGVKGAISSHPAGMLIFSPDDSIRRYVPDMWIPSANAGKGKLVSQYDLAATEVLGLLKQDFLGLRNIATVRLACEYIRIRHGKSLNPWAWVPDEEPGDSKVYKMLGKGQTDGVFQMEGAANRVGIQKTGCEKFEDIVTCTSLFRAGPIIAGAPPRYIQNRKDNKVRVIHPSLKPILEVSWGEMIYDEQMLRIMNEVAGLDWARVDDVKTAMKKKNPEKMAAIKPDAIAGFMRTSGMSEDQAEDTWHMVEAQSSYLFCRAHAVAYSIVSYVTAKLRHDYPLEYFAACLATVEGKNDADRAKRQRYMSQLVKKGHKVLAPDVNESVTYACPEGDDVRLGFVDIKGVGEKASMKLIEGRGDGFKKKWQIKNSTASNVYTALCGAGALESLGVPPDPQKQEELLSWQFYDPLADFREKWSKKRKVPKGDGDCLLVGQIVKTDKRKTKKGTYFVRWQCRWAPGEEFGVSIWDSADELWDWEVGSVIAVEGKWSQEWGNVGIGDSDHVRVLHGVKTS